MSAKALVIVESPAKATTLSRYLGNGFDITASVGHVQDLPKASLAVDVEKGFKPTYRVVEGKEKVVREMRRRAKNAERILLATDPDREGEAIAYHVAQLLGYDRDPSRFGRVRFREVTSRAVKEAVASPSEIDFDRVHAQQARRLLDRLVGYLVSRRLPKGKSAGRVQTVALRLIYEREDEIRRFVEQEYWSITAHLRFKGEAFIARLHHVNRKKVELADEKAAKEVLDELVLDSMTVTALRQRRKRKNAPPPFTTSTLQQQAAKRFRLPVKRTMRLAQDLYDGLPVGSRGRVGLITYMRTDSTRVSLEAVSDARGWVRSEMGDSYVPSKPRHFGSNRKSQAQDAHEAIRPTRVDIHPDEVRRHLDAAHSGLYEMIWKRFVASQMNPAVYDTTTADFDVRRPKNRYLFRSSGSVLRFDGYTRLYVERTESGDHRTLGDVQPLPPLEEKSVAELTDVEPRQHFTQPPPRYSEAGLVKKMEEVGIGRPSTYAQILSRIVTVGYVTLQQRRFTITEDGEFVGKLLVRVLPDTFDVEFTSRMEDTLDLIEAGQEEWHEVLERFYPPFKRQLDDGMRVGEHPDTKEVITLHLGRFGPFLTMEDQGAQTKKASVPQGIDPFSLDTEQSVRIFELPLHLGTDAASGDSVVAGAGRVGPYVRCGTIYADLPSFEAIWEVTLDEALALLNAADSLLGRDPETGRTVRRKAGRYGPYIEAAGENGKPQRASIPEGVDPADVDLDLALRMLRLPRELGPHPVLGAAVEAGLWRGRPKVRCERSYADLPDVDSVWTVGLGEAVALVDGARTKLRKGRQGPRKPLRELGAHPESGKQVNILDGRYGPYVTDGRINASVPKGREVTDIDLDAAVSLLAAKASAPKRKGIPKGRRKRTRGRT